MTRRPFKTRFPFGSVPKALNLAIYRNSPDRSTKSTLSGVNALQLLVNTGFQVLFHSPPGVLFTFPSRYCSTIGHQFVFSLGRWSSLLPAGFHVPRGTPDTGLLAMASCTGLLPSVVQAFLPVIPLPFLRFLPVLYPRYREVSGLGCSAFARRYLRNHFCFLFLRVLRCFSSPRLASAPYFIQKRIPGFLPRVGSPIRISAGQRLFAPLRGFSQLVASFFASWCQGIHPVLFIA
jgi:hypothetical protein